MSTVSRAEYEGERLRVLRESGLDEVEARRRLDKEYPKSTSSAIDELRFRGLDCSEWKVLAYCERGLELAPPIVGGSRVWTRETIDALAEVMASEGRLMPSAIYRAELGLSWTEEQALRLRLEAERKEAAHVE